MSLWDIAGRLIQLYILVIFASVILSWLLVFGVVNRRNRGVYQAAGFLAAMVEPALRPIRRLLPRFGGLDISPLVLILILVFVLDVVIRGQSVWIFIAGLVSAYIFIVIVSAILSWLIAFDVLDRRNHAVYLVARGFDLMTEPALRPIRRVLPDLGGVDISPIVLILFLQLVVIDVVLGWLREIVPI